MKSIQIILVLFVQLITTHFQHVVTSSVGYTSSDEGYAKPIYISESKSYKISVLPHGSSFWVDFDKEKETENAEKIVASISNGQSKLESIKLNFNFPFYGTNIRWVKVHKEKGFMFLGPQLDAYESPDSLLSSYVAPLMTMDMFDLKDQNSDVRILSSKKQFTVEWTDVYLNDRDQTGPFTFQATLYRNSDIVFVYDKLPINIPEIMEPAKIVSVGLHTNCYANSTNSYHGKTDMIFDKDDNSGRKHKRGSIRSETVIIFQSKSTCNSYMTCDQCILHENGDGLDQNLGYL